VGTAVALLIYFRRDWIGIFKGVFLTRGVDWRDRIRPIELIVIATVPAAVIGFLLEKPLKELFGKPLIAAAFLAVNGVLLFVGERIRRRKAEEDSAQAQPAVLTRKGALAIGFWQCLAFIPGLSRSGATLVGGLLAGLTHEAAAHFSFLIATPVILGAAILEVPHLLHQSVSTDTLILSIVGGIVAGIVAYLSTAFLMRYFKGHDFKALDPFAWYCALGGLAAFVILGSR
jgi:undecaprenyl-diphosphatase